MSRGPAALARRLKLLGGGAVLAICAAGLPQLAQAANECGAGTSVTCASAANPYATGITYASPASQTVTLSSGVVVDSTLTPGLSVATVGTGAINVSGPTGVSITSEATGQAGVLLASIDGPITANIATVVTKGDNAPGLSASMSSGSISLTAGSVTTSGLNSTGVLAQAGSGTVTINAATVATTGAGAVGVSGSAGSGAVTITSGAVTTKGANATGILGLVGSGAVTINAGSVATTGAGAVGIQGVGLGATSTAVVTTSGAVSTTGDNAVGIAAVAGGHAGVVTNGAVSTAGLNAPAIQVISGTGLASVNVASGAVTAAKSDGVNISGDTVVAVVGAKGSVAGATSGFDIASTTGATLNNAGQISSSGGFAVQASGGPIAITNSGTITGAVQLTGGADTFSNSGTFVATKDSDFGAGTDSFTNAGTVSVAPTATTPTAVAFNGLESFSNKGAISLQNGHAGDTLTLPGAFTGGTGSTLALDFAGGSTPVADTLVVGGPATGATSITLASTNGGLATDNLVLVNGGAGSTAGAFSLASGSSNIGYIHYDLVYDPGANTYALVGTPNASVVETVKVEELVSDFWKVSSDAWQSHMAQARDAQWAGAGWQGIHGWGQIYGASRDRHDGLTSSAFGVSHAFDLSYDSNTYGFQGGLDLATGPWVAGLTAGYGGADQRFLASHDKTLMQGYNVGAYAGIQLGGAFVQVLAKYNGDQIQMGSLLAPNVVNFSAHTYGGLIDMGYRFTFGSFFFEPVGSFSYSRTLFDNFSALNSNFNFDRYVGEEGKAGLRFGGTMATWNGAKVVPYGALYAVHEFADDNGFLFSNGGFDFGYQNHRRGTYGHATGGLNLVGANGVDGYLQGDMDFSNGTAGGGARVGIRFAF